MACQEIGKPLLLLSLLLHGSRTSPINPNGIQNWPPKRVKLESLNDQMQTMLDVADNTGARYVMCIKVLGRL